MKNIRVLFAIIALAFCASAQQTTANVDTGTKSGGAAPKTSSPPTEGKMPIPPEKLKAIVIPKISAPIVVDGRPDEEIWKTAAVFKDFYQTGPGYNTPPSRPTEVLMAYDEHFLYIAFKCWDERDKVRATVAKRDNVFGEDNVRMWLDTYDDRRRAYVLGFNPLGVQQDGIYTEGQGPDFSVDIVMESKGVIEDWGWSVEVKIPFKSLRYAGGKGKSWGFNAARNIDRFNDEFDQWLPDDRDVSGFLIKHGKITGMDDIKYERTLEVVPSVTLSQTSQRKRTITDFGPLGVYDPIFNPIGLQDPGKFVSGGLRKDFGVNLKYTLSPNITLDAAINPDYAEIEADAPVVSANQRFPIFFEEKRPFFLEGKDIFDSPLQPFYSRTIVDPDVAVKLTGKVGKNTFGFLAASDNAPGNLSEDDREDLAACQLAHLGTCGNEDIVDKNALFGVIRVKHDFGKENNIGFFSTARTFPRNRNFVNGFDGKMKLNPRTVMTFQALETYTESRSSTSNPFRIKNGFGYFWNLDYTADTHGWYAEVSGRTSGYRTDAGFTRRTNSNTAFFANRISTKSNQKAKIIRIDSNQFARYIFDWQGRTQGGLIGANINLQAQGSLFMNVESGLQFEKIYEEEFGPKRDPVTGLGGAFFGAPTRSSKQPYFSVNLNKVINKKLNGYAFVGSIFNAFDYDFGGGPRFNRASPAFQGYLQGPQYASYLQQIFAFQANPVGEHPDLFAIAPPPDLDPGKGHQFDASAGFEYKPIDPLRISMDYTKSSLRRGDTHKLAYDTNIFTLRSTYQFTRFIYVRARWDYDTLAAKASGQLLFGWNPNPGTAFYAGYNDDFNYNGYSPITGQYEPGFQRNGRTFFVRASYLFRKSF